uniref:AAA+ ATPase domain-containing protein n=1 Tax=viral metagenome TaxID=1070528 RepID=A0A6C0HZR2_9ZZZZ
MDPLQIFQFSIYSKIISQISEYNIHPFYIIFFYFVYLTYSNFDNFKNKYTQYFYNDSCDIILGYHKRTIQLYNGKNITKTTYSNKFHAVNNYIFKNKINELDSLYEIVNIKDDKYGDGDNDLEYVLIPNNRNKIRISENPDIYFENIIEQKYDEDNHQNNNSSGKEKSSTTKRKYFTYRLSTNGKENMNILRDFVEKCEKDYTKSKKITQQMVFEYVSTSVDEDDRKNMKFNQYVFKSNKWLDRNIFFDNKKEIIENIRKFPYRKISNETEYVKSATELEYEYYGKSFKNAILLHGPPGCGKTSFIKGVLNETKRHAVLIQWSRIKTCAEFSSLFRSIKISGETYGLGELCYIFEDFDANKMDLLKKRTTLTTKPTESFELVNDVTVVNDGSAITKLGNAKKIIFPSTIIEDELTLDYVLNIFDGIVEMHDAVIIFTTNAKLEFFDPALIRPGRIDTIIEMKECSLQTTCDIIKHYKKLDENEMESIKNKLLAQLLEPLSLTASQLEQICMKSSTVDDIIKSIM